MMPACPALVVPAAVLLGLAGGVAVKLHGPGGASAGELVPVPCRLTEGARLEVFHCSL